MSSANLSRRALVAGAASVPALAVPALTANVDNPDAELIKLGECLKAASAEVDRLKPDRCLYEAAKKAADWDDKAVDRPSASQRLEEALKQNGYRAASEKWNAAANVEWEIAEASRRASPFVSKFAEAQRLGSFS